MDDTKLTIPFPRSTRNTHRGRPEYLPADYQKTYPTSIRFTDDDRATIDKAAHALKMSFGEFTKWCAFYAAIEVNNELHRRSFEETPTTKELDTSGFS